MRIKVHAAYWNAAKVNGMESNEGTYKMKPCSGSGITRDEYLISKSMLLVEINRQRQPTE